MQTEAQQETATTTSLVAALQAMGKGRLAAPHQQLPAMAAVDCAAARLPGSHPSSLYRPPQTMHPAVEDDAHAELKVRWFQVHKTESPCRMRSRSLLTCFALFTQLMSGQIMLWLTWKEFVW